MAVVKGLLQQARMKVVKSSAGVTLGQCCLVAQKQPGLAACRYASVLLPCLHLKLDRRVERKQGQYDGCAILLKCTLARILRHEMHCRHVDQKKKQLQLHCILYRQCCGSYGDKT
jgi:hypothetical protein